MPVRNNADVSQRLVVARVGWCSRYDGSTDDLPRGGGEFNKRGIGSEHNNFREFNGCYYGWAQAPGETLRLDRVADQAKSTSPLDDVCVAFVATTEGIGQVLVGWYRHATMFARYREHPKRGLYHWTTDQKYGVLLRSDDRRLRVLKGKGGMGQANICYARDNDGKISRAPLFKDIRDTIIDDRGSGTDEGERSVEAADAVVRGQGFQYDVRFRILIERRAMALVRRYLKSRYDEVEDRSAECSFDYLARKGKSKRLIEVKGTTTPGDFVLMSRAECELAARERVDLLLVHDIAIEGTQGQPKAVGGVIKIVRNWGSKRLPTRPLGFAVRVRGIGRAVSS